MTGNPIICGRIVKRRFFVALSAGLFLLGGMVAAFGVTGTAFALPLGGMGDFHVSLDKLEGEGFVLHPQIGETGNQDAAPLVRNKIDSATVHGLHIYKDLKLPAGNWIRINITASQPAKIEGLIQDARFIDANLDFAELGIEQTNTSQMTPEEAFTQNWTQNADTITIEDAEIVTDYLFQNMVSLQGAKIWIDRTDGPDQGARNGGDTGDEKGVAASGNDRGGSSDGKTSGGTGGHLPTTASNHWLIISLGALLLTAGAVLAIRKRFFSH